MSAASHPRSRRLRSGLIGAAALGLAAPAVAQASLVYTTNGGPSGRMYLAGDTGAGARVLPVKGISPVLSPDGTRVAFQSPNGRDERLRILTLAGGAVVVSPQGCRFAPQWAPDSSRLACETETADRRGYVTGNGLAIVDAATGAATTLVRAPGNAVDTFSWSPDGSRIAYSRGRFGRTRTDVLTASPGSPATARRLIANATNPVWGPRKVAVVRLTTRRIRTPGGPGQEIHSQIWTVNPGGGGARVLTRYRTRSQLVTGPYPAFWTPDGRRIVGTVGGTDYSQLIAVDARTGAIRALGRFELSFPVAVSRNGKRVLFTEGIDGGPSRTRTIGITGTPGRIVLRNAPWVSASGWAP